MKYLLSGLVCFYSLAALPPLHQSKKEIISVLSHKDVLKKLGSGKRIDSIAKKESGYVITSGECTLYVGMKFISREDGSVGPARFSLSVGKLSC